MNEVFEHMIVDLEKSLEGMPEDAKEFGRAFAYVCIMMELNKLCIKVFYEHMGDFEK